MKYGVFVALVLTMFAVDAGAAHKKVCAVPDFLCAPVPAGGWETQKATGGGAIITMSAKKLGHNEYYQPRVIISRTPRGSFVRGRFDKAFEAYVRKRFAQANPVQAGNGGAYTVRYSFLEHYLPIDGVAIARDGSDFVYMVECRRQSSSEGQKIPLVQWCGDYYTGISWPDDRTFKKEGGDFIRRWSEIEFDDVGLARGYEHIMEQASRGVAAEMLVKDYAGLLITEDLYSSNPRNRSSSQDDLKIVGRIARAWHDPVFDTLIAIHRDYLAGSHKDVEKQMANLVRMRADAPYWLMSRWMAGRNRDAAMSFAERAVIAYPTTISYYTRAALLRDAGAGDEAEKMLHKASADNTAVLSLMAQGALDAQRPKDAARYVKRGEARDPNDLNVLAAKARLYRATSGDKPSNIEDAEALYKRVAEKPGLSTQARINMYYEWADVSYDPATKVDCYNRIIALDRNSPRAYYLLGKTQLTDRHDVDAALKNFRSYLRLAPASDPRVQELRSLVWRLESQRYGNDEVSGQTS